VTNARALTPQSVTLLSCARTGGADKPDSFEKFFESDRDAGESS